MLIVLTRWTCHLLFIQNRLLLTTHVHRGYRGGVSPPFRLGEPMWGDPSPSSLPGSATVLSDNSYKELFVSSLPRDATLYRARSYNSKSSVRCLSVRLSRSGIFFHTGWNTSKIISQPNSYGLQISPVLSQCPYEQKPIKNFGEKGALVYSSTVQFFGYPYYLRNG